MKTINVVAAIITSEGKIYATQRGYGEFKDGWEFPEGKVEPGETPEEAVVREIREELSAEIEVDQYVDTIEYDYPKFHLSMRCYLCHVKSGHLQLLSTKQQSGWNGNTSRKWIGFPSGQDHH